VNDWASHLARQWKGQPQLDTQWERSADQAALRLRHLIVDQAERAYQLEHGKAVRELKGLVPSYLRAIPKGPLTGNEIRLE
jgi:hypothetical protein